MNNGLEQLRINRIKMRAENFAFYYVRLKEVLKVMRQNTSLYLRSTFSIPETMGGIHPMRGGKRNIQAGMETHYDKERKLLNQVTIWVRISNQYIK